MVTPPGCSPWTDRAQRTLPTRGLPLASPQKVLEEKRRRVSAVRPGAAPGIRGTAAGRERAAGTARGGCSQQLCSLDAEGKEQERGWTPLGAPGTLPSTQG